MAIVEIQLNRTGINSLELSADTVDVSGGTVLHVKFINHGAPTHATLRSEGEAFTDFTYENIYVEGESEVHIRIRESAGSGSFPVQVITGYGMRREMFTANVIKSCPAPVAEEVFFPPETPEKPAKPYRKYAAAGLFPVIGLAILLFCLLSAGGAVFMIILYLVMLAGVITAWYMAD
jgi:hypothetical protein